MNKTEAQQLDKRLGNPRTEDPLPSFALVKPPSVSFLFVASFTLLLHLFPLGCLVTGGVPDPRLRTPRGRPEETGLHALLGTVVKTDTKRLLSPSREPEGESVAAAVPSPWNLRVLPQTQSSPTHSPPPAPLTSLMSHTETLRRNFPQPTHSNYTVSPQTRLCLQPWRVSPTPPPTSNIRKWGNRDTPGSALSFSGRYSSKVFHAIPPALEFTPSG